MSSKSLHKLTVAAVIASSPLSHAANNFADAELLANNSTTVVSASTATKEAGEPSVVLFRSNWFRYIAPSRGIVRINIPATSTSSFDPGIHVFRGDVIDKLNKVNNTTFTNAGVTVTFPAEAGMEFRIATSQDSSTNHGNYDLVIQQDAWSYGSPTTSLVTPDMPTSQLVANDDLLNAKSLPSTASTFMVMEYIDSATVGSIGPEPQYTGTYTVWCKWTAPQRGFVSFIAASGLGFTPVVSAYRGNSISALNIVSGGRGGVKFPVEAGLEYKICFGANASDSFPIVFSVVNEAWPFGTAPVITPAVPVFSVPLNDYYETAQTIPSQFGKFGILGYNFSATSASNEVQSGLGYKSLWYKWTAPGDSKVRLSSQTSTYMNLSHAVSVFTGSSFNSNNLIASDGVLGPTDGPAVVDFAAKKGVAYYIGYTVGGESIGGPLVLNFDAVLKTNLGGPEVKIIKPKANAVVSRKAFEIYFGIKPDPEGIGKVRVRVNGKVRFYGTIAKGQDIGNLKFFTGKAVPAGKLKIQIDAQDGEGRWGNTATRYYKAK
jgi:hypothetical protein